MPRRLPTSPRCGCALLSGVDVECRCGGVDWVQQQQQQQLACGFLSSKLQV